MRKSGTSIFAVLIVLFVQAYHCFSDIFYQLKGTYIQYPQYLYLKGTVDNLSDSAINMGYFRGFSRIQSGQDKLFFAYALTN